ncbi:MAG: hypothetical protein MUF25_25055, partial [Pirellulaceae bacterium]|nr:hypothetical protein [Pirellulaceae bacterium]
LDRLLRLVEECDRRGMIVDVTLSRGNGVTGPPRLPTLTAHRRAVESIVTALKPQANWYLDLSNERNIRDQRYTDFAALRTLRAAVRQLDPQRLVTASHAGDISREELGEYLRTVEVDFLSPHRPRHAGSPQQTAAKTRELRAWMQEIGRAVPVHTMGTSGSDRTDSRVGLSISAIGDCSSNWTTKRGRFWTSGLPTS